MGNCCCLSWYFSPAKTHERLLVLRSVSFNLPATKINIHAQRIVILCVLLFLGLAVGPLSITTWINCFFLQTPFKIRRVELNDHREILSKCYTRKFQTALSHRVLCAAISYWIDETWKRFIMHWHQLNANDERMDSWVRAYMRIHAIWISGWDLIIICQSWFR